MGKETATFAAGCFWGVEAEFSKVSGVLSTMAGYTGGEAENPTYEIVCTGKTGHAEAVQVTFDPAQVSYEQLLDVFWSLHDPTQLNRQGPDAGTQYRSAIFYHTPEQKSLALASKEQEQSKYSQPIVTQIAAFDKFYKAEEYHQQYVAKKGGGSRRI